MKHGIAHVAWLLAPLAALAGAGGCSDATPYGVTPVSGKITYEDGSIIPADEMILTFRSMEKPKDPKTHPRTGLSRVNVQNGSFTSVTTYKNADGAITGKHRVSVGVSTKDGREVVPKEYTSEETTPFEVDTASAPFTFLVRKPGAAKPEEN